MLTKNVYFWSSEVCWNISLRSKRKFIWGLNRENWFKTLKELKNKIQTQLSLIYISTQLRSTTTLISWWNKWGNIIWHERTLTAEPHLHWGSHTFTHSEFGVFICTSCMPQLFADNKKQTSDKTVTTTVKTQNHMVSYASDLPIVRVYKYTQMFALSQLMVSSGPYAPDKYQIHMHIHM